MLLDFGEAAEHPPSARCWGTGLMSRSLDIVLIAGHVQMTGLVYAQRSGQS